jgi:hypothetical protein
VILFLAWPMLFTPSGMGQDWSSHLWNMWRQSVAIANEGHPSLFLNFDQSVLYPLYAFYGGTAYALAGILTIVLGNSPVTAYVITWLAGFAVAYGGWFWLGRMAGLGRWAANVPGLLYITSGYYLTLVYARGEWLEFSGVSALPLLAASGLSVLRARRLQLLPALALAGSTLVFFGSHNVVMLWGLTWLALLAGALALALPEARRVVTRAGVMRVLVIAIPAALVNAWYLLPDVVYAYRTSLGSVFPWERELHLSAYLVSAANLLTPFHTQEAAGDPDFVYSLPVVAIAVVLAGIATSLRHRGERAWRRALWIVTGLSALVVVLMTHPGLILELPHPYTTIAYGYRLESFVLLGVSGAMLALLVIARSWPRRLRLACWAAATVALVAAGAGAVIQVDGYPHGVGYSPYAVVPDRYAVIAANEAPPLPEATLGCRVDIGCAFDDNTLPLAQSENLPELRFPSAAIRNDRLKVPVDLPDGGLVRTNLAGAPYFVNVTGARVLGRDPLGHMVLYIEPERVWISLGPSATLPVVLGRVITLVALVFLALLAVAALARHVPMRIPRARHEEGVSRG